jgi:hypothetical protein
MAASRGSPITSRPLGNCASKISRLFAASPIMTIFMGQAYKTALNSTIDLLVFFL